jgi:N12 class adenine-specific DNA methylase
MANPWELDWTKPTANKDDEKKAPWERDWSEGPAPTPAHAGKAEKASEVLKGGLQWMAEGVGQIARGAGRLAQAPIAGLDAMWDGGAAGLDRLASKASFGLLEVDQDLQRQAQQSSADAERARQENIAVDDGTWLNPLTTVARLGKGLEEGAYVAEKFWRKRADAATPNLTAAGNKISDADGVVGTAHAIWDNPEGMIPALAKSLPGMLLGLGLSKAAATGVMTRGMAGAEAAAARVAAAGGDIAAQQAAAAAVLEGVKSQAVRMASGVGVVTEAGTAAMQSQTALMDQVQSIPFEKLQAESPRYRELLAEMGDPEAARARLGVEIGDQAAGLVGLGTAAGSRLTSRLLGGDRTAKIVSGTEKTTFGAAAKNTLQEGVEEVLQGVPEDLAQHTAMLEADPTHKLDLGGSAVQNFVAGAAMGGPASFGAAAKDNYGAARDAARGITDKFRGPGQAPAGAAPEEGAGGSRPMPAQTPETEAEQALYTPRNLTALDRVQEIDGELSRTQARAQELAAPEYGPMFDGERAEVASRTQELSQEREQLAAGWPKFQAGAAATFTTEAGARVAAQYAIADADSLVTSHDTSLRADPRFPAELQPRERDRAASEMQISGIVQKLDPARLGMSADAANGAPIVGADGLVESGNARTIALKRTYEANGLKADEYRDWLRQNATAFGIDPAAIDSVQNPVLVRVRQTPVDRAEFARQANASTVAQMSPSEQARSDAKRIDTMEDLQPDESGDFSGAASRPFVRRFLAKLPITEQSGLIDSDGNLSTAGNARIRNAIMAKAYGDSPVLQRMVESMDDNLRNVSKALVLAAPRVAAMREGVADGSRFDADFTPDLMESVEELSRLKDSGTSLGDALAQTDLMGDKYTPETREILAFLGENMRRPKRMADFIAAYTEALDAAGNPNQAGLFGDAEAPTKSALMGQARRTLDGAATPAQTQENAGRGLPGENPQADPEARGQPAPAPGRDGRDQGNGPAATGQGEWVAFPADSGTLGIPRAEMPQVKSEHRGALVQFLGARGIAHESGGEVPAKSLKPTQAEYSRAKVDRFVATGAVGERAVLVSSDGYVLDGHHQWLGHAERGENIPVIRLDAPIRDLLKAVNEFPSVKRSEGATDLDAIRREAVSDFKNAAADLADILTKQTRATMVPENTPGLMPTLIKLFDAAIRIVGTDVNKATKLVQAELKKSPALKALWNRIAPETYRKAALQALEGMSQPAQGGLFDSVEAASDAMQGDLFASQPAAAPAAPKVAMIDGRAYDPARDNFKAPGVDSFMPKEAIDAANKALADFPPPSGAAQSPLSQEDRARAEALLSPVLQKAAEAKAAFDQAIIDIARRTGALGQMLAPLKGLKRGAEKLALKEGFNVSGMKDLLRSTIVVRSYADAQAVMEAIEKEFKLLRAPKNRTGDAPLRAQGKDVPAEDPSKYGGYSDIMVNVVMPNGTIAEIQINTPDMLAAKSGQGHDLYESLRVEQRGTDRYNAINAASQEFYNVARAAAKKSASVAADQRNGQRVVGAMPFQGDFSSSTNRLPSGNSTNINSTPSPSVKSIPNLQPSGNFSGTRINTPSGDSVASTTDSGYIGTAKQEDSYADAKPGQGSDQGQGAEPSQATRGKRQAERVREGSGEPDLFGSGEPDAGAAPAGELGSTRADGVRGTDEDGGKPESGKRARRASGIPAGRDLPAKSGLNYQFGQEDLTYEGSWFKKAEQNVQAVELLKKLQAEGRQATAEEQKVLAKFIGWGASEIANTLFGKKLDKAAQQKATYERIIAKMEAKGRDYLSKGGRWRGDYADDGYYEAIGMLREAGKSGIGFSPDQITKEDLAHVKPDTSLLRYVDLRDRLKAVMSREEWAEAARSTQYAHYTSKGVVQSMWNAMARMGFAGGAILEPGAGIGVFPGLMPQGMANASSYTGIEFDTLTGGILQQLFPDERILVESFMDSKLPKNFYDIAIGNPPFQRKGAGILSDPEYAKKAFALHDYFFAKSIDRVKPGGLVAFVTSRFTMDKLNDKGRAYLAERADLVGAIRLPQTAFKQNAGTEVVTDIIFLRKKEPGKTFEQAKPWMKTAEVKDANGKTLMVKDKDDTERPALINEYFAAHPEMVLGTHANTGSMYSDKEYTVEPRSGDAEAHFAKAIENLPADIYRADRGSLAEAAKIREIDFNPKAKKEGNFYVTDAGVLMQREGGIGQRVELKSPAQVELVKDFVPLRDALKQAHFDQLSDGDWEASLAGLQKAYKVFTAKHGQVNQFKAKTVNVTVVDEDTGEKTKDEQIRRSYPILDALKDDPDWTLVAALEKVNDDTGAITQSEFLTTRVLGKPETPKVSSAADALLTVLNDMGEVDMGVVAARAGITEAEAIESLGAAVYQAPDGGWAMADDYLSGNVKRKLKEARAAAQVDRRYERNVAALEAVQPAPKSPSQINVAIGMNWIPGGVYSRFMQDITGLAASIEWNKRTKEWALDWETPEAYELVNKWGTRQALYKTKAGAEAAAEKKNAGRAEPIFSVRFVESTKNKAALEEWGTDSVNAFELLKHALTGKQIRVEKIDPKTKSRGVDEASTEAANAKLAKLREAFENWIWQDQARTDMLVQEFNDRFNTTVARSFDGSHLTLPGASKTFKIFDHVKRGAWRIIQKGNTYLAHAVGSGKTFQMVIAAMEQKRLGLIKKPMIVVPNHMLQQFASEWQQLYPAARLMVADENNFHTDNRRRFVSRVALSDLDGVVITHSAFKLLDLDPAFKAKMIEEQLRYLEAALEEAGGKPGESSREPKVKQIQSQIENMEQKLKAAMSSDGKDNNVRFDELGVDQVMVDEAHEFRKLDFGTSRQVKGLSPQGSARSFDLFMKTRWLEEKNPGRSLIMASGTPITNTMAEMYSVQRFMDPKALEERDIEDFDSWASMFGRESTQLEANAAGTYEPVTRFNKFVNVPELTQMFRDFADVLTSDHLAELLGDKRPKVDGGSRKIIATPKQRAYPAYQRELERRVLDSRAWKPSKDEPNNPDPMIRIIGDGRLAAIDMRFVDPKLESDPDSKLNRLIDDVIAKAKETADMEFADKAGNIEPNKGAAMMVFSDLGFGEGVAANRGFNARAWFEKRLKEAGIPASQIAFMSDHKKSTEKLKLFKDVNAGRVRILVGSSKNMGTGVNAQQRLKALFHLDSPWYPADLEQREGRIVRQGNKNKLVQLFAYAAKGSYDQVMWQMLASKHQFIDLALSGDPNVRELEDLSSQSEYELAAAMTAEDPRVMQLAGMRADIAKMQRLYQAHEESRIKARDRYQNAETTIEFARKRLPDVEAAAEQAADLSGDNWAAKLGKKTVTERKAWADALLTMYEKLAGERVTGSTAIGSVSGFELEFDGWKSGDLYGAVVNLKTPAGSFPIVQPGGSAAGFAMRAVNAINAVRAEPARMRERIREAAALRDSLQTKITAPFPMAEMLAEKIKEAGALTDAIAADSQPKPFWVESKATGLGFTVNAPNAERAIELARESKGGTADEWTARLASENAPAAPAATTPAFKKWFGNSKVVDADGKPRVMYHGAKGEAASSFAPATYFTEDAEEASMYAGSGAVQPVFIRIENPYEASDESDDENRSELTAIDEDYARELAAQGYDGVIARRNGITLWAIPFLPEQIKSAIGNNGNFDPAEPDIRLSRASRANGQPAGVKAAELDAMVAVVSKAFPGLPPVKVLEAPASLPADHSLRRAIESMGAMGDAEGALHDGTIYLFANHLADMHRAEHVLLEHEAAHAGLRAILGDKLGQAMQAIYNNNASVRRQADALRASNTRMSTAHAVEEVIVDIPTQQLAKLTGWRKLVERVRDALASAGFTRTAARLGQWLDGSLSEQQRADLFVANLVRDARAAKTRPATDLRGTGTALQDGKLADDLAAQEKWLMAEARARGFTDIEDLLAKNYPLFEKLAAKWREKNPAEALLSRKPETKAAYEARIEALFAGARASLTGVRVLDRTELLGLLGYADKPVTLAEGKVIAGQAKHPAMTAEVWKKIPEWIDAPAAVFDSDTEQGRLVFVAPELIGGSMALIIVEPKANGLDAHLLLNAYDKDGGPPPIGRWLRDGLGRYIDQKKFPAILTASRLQLPGTALQNKPGTRKMLTEKNLRGYMRGASDTVLSRAPTAPAQKTVQERANDIIQDAVGRAAPLDRIARGVTRLTGVEYVAAKIYNGAGFILNRFTPEKIKAGVISDYGVPEAVIDQRAMLQGRQRVQLRKAGNLIEKLSTLTRAESRVAYAWMNEADPHEAARLMDELPADSVQVLGEVATMIEKLSREAIAMGQLSPEAYERNKFAYLRRSYLKHVLPQDEKGQAARSRTISILGEQYKGRGLTEAATMQQIQNTAPEWWKRKVVPGKADTSLKGEKFIRLERRGPVEGAGMDPLQALEGPANPNAVSPKKAGRLLEIAYYPAGEALPAKYRDWDQAGTWEVRTVKGNEVVFWRDFTKAEREKMGEIDEARFAIAKTLHGMIHDVEVGRYLEWLAHGYALKPGQQVPGKVVEATERYRDTFAIGEWVQVPDSKIPGTNVPKYGKLAGRYLPGPIWNDLRQTVSMEFGPLGETYQAILSAWKTAKTALSPAVHMNNVMSNFVMADWHDVGAKHIAKSLRILLAAQKGDGRGLIGRTGNNLGKLGIADREAAREIVNRYLDSGGDIGSWVTAEISSDQIEPMLQALQAEANKDNPSVAAQVGVMSALQHALHARFPQAWEAFKAGKGSGKVVQEGQNLIDLYQAEDDVFRLAAWLRAKEDGRTDLDAGKSARTSFLDYRVNAPWIQAMRQTAWPFISFSYRAIPMLIETAGKRPHKLLKLMMVLGALNALGSMLAGGDDEEERKLLPEEKAGRIWGMVPKLIRMPWNDDHGSPVYLDIRRYIPVGDVFDLGAGQSAVPLFPAMQPGGPLVIMGEVVLNKSAFTGKAITLETDTASEKAGKLVDHLWKAFAPNLLGVPGTYATTGVKESIEGRTDAFGREMSTVQATASAFGVKLGSYPADVLRRNLNAKAMAEMREIDMQIAQLQRQRQTQRLDADEYRDKVREQQDKKREVVRKLQEKVAGR